MLNSTEFIKKVFTGKAFFSASVASATIQTWTKNGGNLAGSMVDEDGVDWFFCVGMNDPSLARFLRSGKIVFHAEWISAAARAQFPVPVAKYVLDGHFRALETRVKTVETPRQAALTGSDCSNTQSIPHYHLYSDIDKKQKTPSPLRIRKNKHRRLLSAPYVKPSTIPNVNEQATEGKNGKSQKRTIILPRGPDCAPLTFEIETIPPFPPKPSHTTAHSRKPLGIPSNIWQNLGLGDAQNENNINNPHTISVADTVRALSVVPTSDLTFFVPGEVHLAREFVYVGVDRRKTI
ncbi:hypothetical protein BD410DRAFT_783770 [Rickenella mellea]|uniref:BRCT domain-containing protein n=1 Tax=Rickenella mellea TaxID=50990 RepID=A0A4Y7QHT2_9AGAM|nr:hypothetical protein BD410DRAFT_783770 [Rickenella mellea]